jgi:hypothetical protein
MTSTTRRAILHLAAMALPVLTVVACIGGVDNPPIAQMLTPDSSSTGGLGSGGGFVVGLYKLSSFNGVTLPDTILNTGIVGAPDSAREVWAILDSAELQLDSDSTVIEKDYFQMLVDLRGPNTLPGPTYSFSTAAGGDSVICGGGTYIDTAASQTSFLLGQQSCFSYGYTADRLANSYAVSGDSLTGTVNYQFYDSAATTGVPVYSALVPVVWKFFGPSSITAQHGVAAPKGTLRKGKRIVLQHQ